MRKINIRHHRKWGREQLGKGLPCSLGAMSFAWPKRLHFLASLTIKTAERDRGTRTQIKQEAHARYSPMEGVGPGDGRSAGCHTGWPRVSLERKHRAHFRARPGQWSVHPQAVETQLFPTTHGLCSLDILDGLVFSSNPRDAERTFWTCSVISWLRQGRPGLLQLPEPRKVWYLPTFITPLKKKKMRYDLHKIHPFKYTVQWFLVYPQICATVTTIFTHFCLPSQTHHFRSKQPLIYFLSLLNLPHFLGTESHDMWLYDGDFLLCLAFFI